MPFTPVDTNLGSINLYENFEFEFSYQDELDNFYPVNINVQGAFDNVNVTYSDTSGKVSGFFSLDVFDIGISYSRVNDDNVKIEVNSFNLVPADYQSYIYKVNQFDNLTKNIVIDVEANNITQTYNLSIVNDYGIVASLIPSYINNEIVSYDSLAFDKTFYNEGDTATVNLTTSNVPNGTQVGYTISGIDDNDLDEGNITGIFNIENNFSSIQIKLSNDNLTEDTETATITLNGTDDKKNITNALSSSVNIIDTSKSAATYNITTSQNSIDEGEELQVDINTTFVENGTLLYWSVDKPDRFNESDGIIEVQNNNASFTLVGKNDLIIQDQDVFVITIRKDSVNGEIVSTSENIVINNTTSQNSYSIDLFVGFPDGLPQIEEGISSAIYVTSDSVLPDGIEVFWSLTNSDDFEINSGSFIFDSSSGSYFLHTIPIEPTADLITEGDETFFLLIRLEDPDSPVFAQSEEFTILDTSQTPVLELQDVATNTLYNTDPAYYKIDNSITLFNQPSIDINKSSSGSSTIINLLNDLNSPWTYEFYYKDKYSIFGNVTTNLVWILNPSNERVFNSYIIGGDIHAFIIDNGDGSSSQRTGFRPNRFSDPDYISPAELTDWIHIAYVARSPKELDVYINGFKRQSLEWSVNDAGDLYNLSSYTLEFGPFDTYGLFSEIRVSNIERYTNDFTVPSGPFTPDTNTMSLLRAVEG